MRYTGYLAGTYDVQWTVGAVQQQIINGTMTPIGFFSQCLEPVQMRNISSWGVKSLPQHQPPRLSGIRTTQCLLLCWVIWPRIWEYLRRWAHQCLTCQSSKIHWLMNLPVDTLPLWPWRFEMVGWQGLELPASLFIASFMTSIPINFAESQQSSKEIQILVDQLG